MMQGGRTSAGRRHGCFGWFLLAVFVAAIGWAMISDNPFAQGIRGSVGWKHDQPVLDKSFSLPPRNFRYYKFSLPDGSTNVAVVGQFSSSVDKSRSSAADTDAVEKDKEDSTDNGVEVYVLSEAAFAVWQRGSGATTVYKSGRIPDGKVQADLPDGAGVYYLVFNNRFSATTAKSVNANFSLHYKSWVQKWFAAHNRRS